MVVKPIAYTCMRKILIVFALILLAAPSFAQIPDSIADDIKVIKKYVFEDYKQMIKQPTGALLYPYITPGSKVNRTQRFYGIGIRG